MTFFISCTLTQKLAQTRLFIITVMINLYCNLFIPQRLVYAQSHRERERKITITSKKNKDVKIVFLILPIQKKKKRGIILQPNIFLC